MYEALYNKLGALPDDTKVRAATATTRRFFLHLLYVSVSPLLFWLLSFHPSFSVVDFFFGGGGGTRGMLATSTLSRTLSMRSVWSQRVRQCRPSWHGPRRRLQQARQLYLPPLARRSSTTPLCAARSKLSRATAAQQVLLSLSGRCCYHGGSQQPQRAPFSQHNTTQTLTKTAYLHVLLSPFPPLPYLLQWLALVQTPSRRWRL